jgi:Asp-tRNA(Asn)/Glu-tRNA(Gln) amidotransferase A subunit family amidase
MSPAQQLRLEREAIAARNPQVNAFVHLADGPAVPAAGGTSPLAGASFAVKDNIDVAGLPSQCGLRALQPPPATADAPVVARLRAAGLVFAGKLNMHAMALGATNHNADFGDCRNPHRLTHTPGGSSGGSAAAVAAGFCRIALGTDTMGSVRVPASYCGVVGFKPSFEALPTQGVTPLSRLLDHVGVLARSVDDVREAFRILSAQAPGTAEPAGAPSKQPELAVPADLGALGAEPEVRAAFEQALGRLRAAGFRPLEIPMPELPRVRRAGLLLAEAELARTLAEALAQRRSAIPQDLLAMLDYAAGKGALDLAGAVARLQQMAQWVTRALDTVDALLLPTTPQTAFPLDAPVPHNQADFTVLANVAGAPAISLPLPVAAGALPIGLQAIGRRGADGALLRLAAQIESTLRAAQA